MHSKKYQKASQFIDPSKVYPIEEALDLLKKTSYVKFDASLELHLHLGIDISKSEQNVRGGVILPYGTGKSKKVIAIVSSGKEKEAKEAGADIVIIPPIQELKSEILNLKSAVIIATPDAMPALVKFAKTLGPRGLMPNPKTGTVGENVKKMIEEQKAGKVDFKNDATGNIHQIFGKVSFDNKKLLENLGALIAAIKKSKPSGVKGEFIKNAYICATMGPGIKISL